MTDELEGRCTWRAKPIAHKHAYGTDHLIKISCKGKISPTATLGKNFDYRYCPYCGLSIKRAIT